MRNNKGKVSDRILENKKIQQKNEKRIQKIGLFFSIILVVFGGYIVGEKLGNHIISQKIIENETNIEDNQNYRKAELNFNSEENFIENDTISTISIDSENEEEIIDEIEESIVIK